MFTQALFTQAYFNMTVTDVKVHSPCECTGGGKCGYGEVRCACGGGVVQCADDCGVCVVCECTGNGQCDSGEMKCDCLGDGACGHVEEVVKPKLKCLIVQGRCVTRLVDDEQGNTIEPKPVPTKEMVSCRSCKQSFHAWNCTGSDPLFGTKSLITNFLGKSTKSNFMFLCDECLTVFEEREADVESQRISRVEKRLTNVENRILSEIKSLSCKVTGPPPVTPAPIDSLWADKSRVETLKVKASFMVRPDNEGKPTVSPSKIGDLANKLSIPVQSTSTDSKGRTWVTTKDQESCDKLKSNLSQGESPVDSSKIVNVFNKTPTVAIVGLKEELDKDVIFDTIMRVNSFGPLMNTTSFRILSVKQTKKSKISGSQPVFQCVVAVSDMIREIIEKNNNRVFFHENCLHCYDQFHVKRCNNCQSFHHYSDKCTSSSPVCSNCAGRHSTADCSVNTSDSKALKCANCGKLGAKGDVCHKASDPNCPSFLAEQTKLKKSIKYYSPKN